ncbi:hypothetical protein WAF17_21055 [Bernardetia sp. ABR2-2B]|uniref:hypothetical protein n=1 Tax=Bernardetia sp. ABR2-2B TaxID=3127472 RepID=UPI0030D2DE8B
MIISDDNPLIIDRINAYSVQEYLSFLVARYDASEKVRVQMEKQHNKNNKK